MCAEVEKLVILGAGPAGLTSALFAGQAHLDPLVIEGEPADGQIASIYRIENFPGFYEGISGLDLSMRIRTQAEIFGARFYPSQAIAVDLSQRPFHIVLADGVEIVCESLVIATGASPKWLGLESEAALIGRGVSASATLDAHKFNEKAVIVIGGGDSAMEQALLLAEHATQVTIICKNEKLHASSYLQERVFQNPKIAIKYCTEVIDIRGVDVGRVTGVLLRHSQTKKENVLPCEGVFVSNGRQPNTGLFIGQLKMTDVGYIITKPDSTLTSVPGVFAAGDIVHTAYRKVITSAASGCMTALDAAKFLVSQQ